MSRLRCRSLLWIVVGLLWVGCSGSISTVAPPPLVSPAPPVVAGRGTLAVVNVADPNAKRVWIFPPHSDKFSREIIFHGSQFEPNSLAFDRRGHIYIGVNDTSSPGAYRVLEVNVRDFKVAREIDGLRQWNRGSVGTDDQSNLYVATKAFVGGDIKIFRPDRGTRPYIEIKDPLEPIRMLVGRNALWVGYTGAAGIFNALARYRLRSTDQTWVQSIGSDLTSALAANPDDSLLAAVLTLNKKGVVDVFDPKSRKRARILEGHGRMTSDESGNLYVAERPDKVHVCSFRSCTHAFETPYTWSPLAVAVSPLDGMLYVTTGGKPSLEIYDPRTGKLVMRIAQQGFQPTALAIEP